MEKKKAVYICTGCGIGDALDIKALSQVAVKEGKIPLCRTHEAFCGQEGIRMIQQDIAQEGVNALIIAACSPRVMVDRFTFENCLVERVNLREQVIWAQPAGEENTQMMAEDYLRMAAAKMKTMELPEPYQPPEEISRELLVVGGGWTGLNAALEAAKAGRKVLLLEKEAELGGFQRKVAQKVTFPFKEVKNNDIHDLIQAVKKEDRIQVCTSAKITSIAGGPGSFDVEFTQNGNTVQRRVGAIVQAAGWQPYDPTKLDPKLGFGSSPNVITNVIFEEMAGQGRIVRPTDKKEINKAAFIQCAGSRDPEHLPYCSTVCCQVSLKQALQIKSQNPEAGVFVIFKELRTPGQAEDLYRKAQEAGVVFIRSQDCAVKAGGTLTIEAEDELLGEKVSVTDLDLVVLATGMVPVTSFGEDVASKEKERASEQTGKEELQPSLDTILISDILNLQYRQGPELPSLQYGFPDSHFICFPYETRRTGVYAAGCVRRPMGTAAAAEDAAGAVMKALQCIELTSQGKAVHPRVGDTSFPEFFMQRCTQCKRCTVECPFGTINEDEKANPIPFITRCRRCSICMGACPERIISFKNYSVGMIGDMIKAINVPEEDEEKPRILVLACENDAYPALDMVGLHRTQYAPWFRVIPLRCLGSLNLVWIADALSKGIDGVLLLGCKHGEDYQCHMVKGSELANIRLSKIKETLDRLALESDRVRFETVTYMDYDKLPALLQEFASKIEEVGPNPYKGF